MVEVRALRRPDGKAVVQPCIITIYVVCQLRGAASEQRLEGFDHLSKSGLYASRRLAGEADVTVQTVDIQPFPTEVFTILSDAFHTESMHQ
jgi:hypothetical protein